jgi:hypothetical protein
MKIGTFDGKLVEEVGGTDSPVVFLKVLNDEDKEKCPHCGKPVPTEIVSVVSSPHHKEKVGVVAPLTANQQDHE